MHIYLQTKEQEIVLIILDVMLTDKIINATSFFFCFNFDPRFHTASACNWALQHPGLLREPVGTPLE